MEIDFGGDTAIILLHNGVAEGVDDIGVEHRVVRLVGGAVHITCHQAGHIVHLASTQNTVPAQQWAVSLDANAQDSAVIVVLEILARGENLPVIASRGVGRGQDVDLAQNAQGLGRVVKAPNIGAIRQAHTGLSRTGVDASDEVHSVHGRRAVLDNQSGAMLNSILSNHVVCHPFICYYRMRCTQTIFR